MLCFLHYSSQFSHLRFCASLEFHISMSTPLLFSISVCLALVCSSVATLSVKCIPVLPHMIKPTKTVAYLRLGKEREKSQLRNPAAGEESGLMGDTGHAFSQKVTWQTNGSPVPLMHPIIIASDFHLPFSLFQELPINLALKEMPSPGPHPSLAAKRVSIT